MISPCCLRVSPNFFCVCSLCRSTCLQSRCLATAVSSGSAIPAFKCHVISHSKDAGRGVLYAVRVLFNTLYIVKGK
jgi:hypothetical protein